MQSREANEKGNQGGVRVLGEEGVAFVGTSDVMSFCSCFVFSSYCERDYSLGRFGHLGRDDGRHIMPHWEFGLLWISPSLLMV